MKSMARQAGVSPEKTFADLPQKTQDAFFYGSKERLSLSYGAYEYKTDWKGAVAYLMARAEDMKSDSGIAAFESLISPDGVPGMPGPQAPACITCGPGWLAAPLPITLRYPLLRRCQNLQQHKAERAGGKDCRADTARDSPARELSRDGWVGLHHAGPAIVDTFGRRRPTNKARHANRLSAPRSVVCAG